MKVESAEREPVGRSGARRRSEASQAIVLGGVVVLVSAAWRADLASRPTIDPPRDAAAIQLRIDLNAASVEELMLLPGIGARLAERIVEHRQASGRFESLEELGAVHGIGPAKARSAAEYLYIAE